MQLLRPISLSLAVAALTAIVVYIGSYLIYPISGIEVEGTRMLPKSQVWAAVPSHTSLITINGNLLEDRLQSNPWVESVGLDRDWTSGIVTVEVEEREAFLSGEVDGREVSYASDGAKVPNLGAIGMESVPLDPERLEDILKAGKTLRNSGVEVGSIIGAGPSGIELTAEDKKILFAEEIRPAQARALTKLMAENPRVPSFDLRSPQRVIVDDRLSGEPSG